MPTIPSIRRAVAGADGRTPRAFSCILLWVAAAWVACAAAPPAAPGRRPATAAGDQKAVAALDSQYQAAVKRNDAATMARILADDFILVTGSGKTYTKEDLLEDARSRQETYERNDEEAQTVRVWGDTAVVTARLWEKGRTAAGKTFDRRFWFSDTYVRTREGWKYVFGQSSLPPSDASGRKAGGAQRGRAARGAYL